MNEWIVVVLDAATNPNLASDEASRLRERLRGAGLLVEQRRSDYPRRPDPAEVAAAGKRAARGTPVSELVLSDR